MFCFQRGEESRASVAPADMQTGITRGSLEAAEAYRRILDLAAILVELGVFTYFTLRENPSAIYFVAAMPTTMLLYFLLTLCRRELDEWEDQEQSVLRLVNEACQRYRPSHAMHHAMHARLRSQDISFRFEKRSSEA